MTRRHSNPRCILAAVLGAALAVLALTACGSDNDDAAEQTTVPEPTSPATSQPERETTTNDDSPAEQPDDRVGYEILEVVGDGTIRAWGSADLTQEEFDAIDLPAGWRKNQPREGTPDGGFFYGSPGAGGEIVEEEHFGHQWEHWATITDPGKPLDDEGLLVASTVEKDHEISFDAGRTLSVLIAPEGDVHVLVSRDAGRSSDTFTVPEGWEVRDHPVPDGFTTRLTGETLVIRTDNQDSYQGPVEGLDLGETVAVPLVGAEAEDANVGELLRFVEAADGDDGPFYMVNLIRHRDRAEYPDGRETDLTGAEADAIYGDYMMNTKLPEIGAEIVYVADVEQDMFGGTAFDRVAVVRYPSRASVLAMNGDPEFQEMAVHKQAGVLDTVVLATELISESDDAGPADPPFPPTTDDPPFAFVHVLDYHDTARYAEGDADADPNRSGEEAVEIYSRNAGTVAAPLGVRPAAWFDVQATIIGPRDVWDEVRINTFPSHATFRELTSDPTWQSGAHHRAAGLAGTYALMTLPYVNQFNGVTVD